MSDLDVILARIDVLEERLASALARGEPKVPQKAFVGAAELARIFEVSVRTVETWKRKPRFPLLKAPGSRVYRYDIDQVREWLDANRARR